MTAQKQEENEGREMIYITDPKTGEKVAYPKEKVKVVEPGLVPEEPFIDTVGPYHSSDRVSHAGVNLLSKR